MNQEIIKKLKSVRTTLDKKWLYVFAAYIIKNQNNYSKLQVKINSIHYQSKGIYKDYYQKLSDRDKVKYNKRNAQRLRTNKEQLIRMKQRRKIETTAGKLYLKGLLSKKSTHLIDDNIQEVLS